MKRGAVVDAAALPDQGFGQHAPIWWGSTLMILIEVAGLAILVATYFYIWRNFDTWPPTGTLVPDLGVPTINLLVLLASVLPMRYVARLAHRRGSPKVLGSWLLLCVLFGLTAAVLRVLEFKGVHTRFYSNAYGAIVWSILAVHFAHIIAAMLETLVSGVGMFLGPVAEQQFVDVAANAVYWYFVVFSWVGLYIIVFFAPRVR